MSPFREGGTPGLSIFDTAFGGFDVDDRDTDEEKDVSGVEIKKIVEARPGLTKKLEELMDPKLDSDRFLNAVGELNTDFGIQGERQGAYRQVRFDLPCGGKLNVKVFTEMENGLSFSGSAF